MPTEERAFVGAFIDCDLHDALCAVARAQQTTVSELLRRMIINELLSEFAEAAIP